MKSINEKLTNAVLLKFIYISFVVNVVLFGTLYYLQSNNIRLADALSGYDRTLIVNGVSMNPSLENRSRYGVIQPDREIRTGDIVSYYFPPYWLDDLNSRETSEENYRKKEDTMIKRVVALEGDTISFTRKGVSVNNQLIIDNTDKSFRKECSHGGEFRTVLKENEMISIGDNLMNSYDAYSIWCSSKRSDFESVDALRKALIIDTDLISYYGDLEEDFEIIERNVPCGNEVHCHQEQEIVLAK